MRKLFIIALALAAVFGLAAAGYAEDGGTISAGGKTVINAGSLGTILAAVAIGMGIAAAGCGIAQGLGLKAACEGVARNPEASNKIQTLLILGLAFIESLAIYALVVCLLLLLVNPLIV